jgi:hypothetical protein
LVHSKTTDLPRYWLKVSEPPLLSVAVKSGAGAGEGEGEGEGEGADHAGE